LDRVLPNLHVEGTAEIGQPMPSHVHAYDDEVPVVRESEELVGR
jgi:hypothetical protein